MFSESRAQGSVVIANMLTADQSLLKITYYEPTILYAEDTILYFKESEDVFST